MKRVIAWFVSRFSPQPEPSALGKPKPPVMTPNHEDSFTLGSRAERLMLPQAWDDLRVFCSVQAEREILDAKDDLASAAAAAHRAQALLNLPTTIEICRDTAASLKRQQEADQQQKKAAIEEDEEVFSRKFSARFAQ